MLSNDVSKMNIKVLFLTHNPGLHGPLPKHNPVLIKALEEVSCQVIRCSWGAHSDHENLLQKIFERLGDLFYVMVETARMKPDIIFVATYLDHYTLARDIPLLLATGLSPAKKVLKMHGSPSSRLVEPGSSLFKLFTKILVCLSDAILLLSTQELREWAEFAPKGKHFRVDNPFLPMNNSQMTNADTKPNRSTCTNLFFAGRLIKAKGIFDLLDAMPIIIRQHDCRLLIAGEGPEEEAIKQQIEKANLGQFVSMLGYIDVEEQLFEIYKSSSIFILPSYAEGFPTVISEAMSVGLPIVTTYLRGSADHLEEGVNSLFVPPKEPNAIANAVMQLINDPVLCRKMGQANLSKVRDFLPEKIAPQYIKIFKHLLGYDSL